MDHGEVDATPAAAAAAAAAATPAAAAAPPGEGQSATGPPTAPSGEQPAGTAGSSEGGGHLPAPAGAPGPPAGQPASGPPAAPSGGSPAGSTSGPAEHTPDRPAKLKQDLQDTIRRTALEGRIRSRAHLADRAPAPAREGADQRIPTTPPSPAPAAPAPGPASGSAAVRMPSPDAPHRLAPALGQGPPPSCGGRDQR